MKCPNCQHSNRVSANYCEKCGMPLNTPPPEAPLQVRGDTGYDRSVNVNTQIGSREGYCPLCNRGRSLADSFICWRCKMMFLCPEHQDKQSKACERCVEEMAQIEQLTALRAQHATLSGQFAALQDTRQQLETALQATQNDLADAQRDLEAARALAGDHQAKSQRATATQKAAAARIAELEQTVQQLSGEADGLRRQLAAAQTELSGAQAAHAADRQQLTNLGARVAELERAKAQLEADAAWTQPVPGGPPAHVKLPHIVKGPPPLNIAWCWVPGGPFALGNDDYSDAKPVHQVNVTGFWLARYPVTSAQYRLFIDGGGYRERRWWTDAGWAWREEKSITQPWYWTDAKWNGAQQPVVGVSWYEAVAFCAWAADVCGAPIRLPTEAEWEKAARGTDGRRYPWGNAEPTYDLCNYNYYSDKQGAVGKTTDVGRYSPAGDGPFGHADLAGNVWEWVQSKYQAYPYAEDGRNDKDGTDVRMVRGGAWNNNSNNVRSADRRNFDPAARINLVGFRLAQE